MTDKKQNYHNQVNTTFIPSLSSGFNISISFQLLDTVRKS